MDQRRLLERASALGIEYVESVPARAVAPAATIEELRATLDLPLPDSPTDGLEVIDALARDVEPGLVRMGSGVARRVDRSCAHARALAAGLSKLPGCEILNDVVLNQVLLRFRDDQTTDRIVEAVQASGEAWMGGTVWDERRAIRISVSSWQTSEDDVERTLRAFAAACEEAGVRS